jgi:gamma-glutamyl-gamma-aminobutyrate hydrolase PuuD
MIKNLRIGISTRMVKNERFDENIDIISHDWINLFEQLNFIPILIPNILNDVLFFLEKMNLDGIILSGGDNIGDFPDRDKTESEIIKFSIQENIPLFGVCRGMQVINNFFNGRIQNNVTSKHVRKNHKILFLKNNFCNLNTDCIEVNSFHNNLINKYDLGDDLESLAIASIDDSIESISHKKYKILAVMWHPERKFDDNNKNILKYFFDSGE